jgi:hypothetical protein
MRLTPGITGARLNHNSAPLWRPFLFMEYDLLPAPILTAEKIHLEALSTIPFLNLAGPRHAKARLSATRS